ncbi:Meckel syndrome type 1 [Brachionus plicatilis]|uniref:Meckel syndrome type 1 n=1 Tax=Brachionus plicatilis TaxID=10195 RepID=A0A3M7T8V9_BRAPC|nr:Meckel syndrome type 1 [Brachionus plicatilis]
MNNIYSSCIYRSKDPIRNFKIKVTLQRATGKIPNQIETEKLKELEKIRREFVDLNSKKEEAIISWQAKIFSKREYIKYINQNFVPQTILEEHYQDECLKLKERNYQPGRIFTYIDSDPYEFYDEIDAEVNNAPKSAIPSFLEKNTNFLKKRTLVGKTKPSEMQVPKKDIVNYSPTKDDSKKFQSKIVPFHTMYIMADLSTAENTFTMNDEVVLCCIKIDSNGAIIMKPDFSSISYFIQTGGFARETYEYTLEHVSSCITNDDLLKENRLHKELYLRHSDYIKNLVGKDFKMPLIGVMKVHIFGEILSAKNFDYDDLHVYYQLDLPKNWHIDRSVPLSGFTPTSRTKIEGNDEIAYFSHPFEFDLYYKNDEYSHLNRGKLHLKNLIFF